MATNWDKDKPAGSQKIRLSDEEIRANNAAVEDALGRNHNFPGNESSDAGEHTVVELQDQSGDPVTPASVIGLYNNGDELFFRKESSGVISLVGGVPSGTKMLFPQNSAPVGWTFSATNNDKVLINQSTEANGGTTGGSWTISGISVDNHTLATSEIPAHTHDLKTYGSQTEDDDRLRRGDTSSQKGTATSESTGGGSGHNHNMTIGSSWRPAWLGVITCTKD